MPKRVFWPVALIVMGLIFLASNLRLLPDQFWNLWPLILIVVGLGGLVTSDREDWDVMKEMRSTRRPATKAASKTPAKKAKRK
ncbi:MAG TPA: DUF5668 domain-containing protein [Vitreimonas sp.]|nr:DUF5668 domain-containing protein [Vitreimonas sp.]